MSVLPAIGTEIRYPADAPRRHQRRGWIAAYTGRPDDPLEVWLYTDGARSETVSAGVDEVTALKARRVARGFRAVDLQSEAGEMLASLRLREDDAQMMEDLARRHGRSFGEEIVAAIRTGMHCEMARSAAGEDA